MKPAPFEYLSPGSLEEALDSLAEYGDEAKLLAGGQSLIPAMNFRLVQPSVLLDINNVNELGSLTVEDDVLRIGAMVRQSTLERDGSVSRYAPLLHETLPYIAHLQIRNRGTIGGSLAHADPAAELPAIMVSLDARFRLVNRDNARWVPAKEFFKGIFTTELMPDEILTEIQIPATPLDAGGAFVEFARRKGDYALIGVAATVSLDGDGKCKAAKLVYLNAGEVPIDAVNASGILVDEQPTSKLLRETGYWAAENEIHPSSSIHASEPYLRHLAAVLTERALRKAFDRAGTSVD